MMSNVALARADESRSPAIARDPRWKWLTIVLLFVTLLTTSGCGSHPEVSSPESLMLIKLVYTAANTRSPQRLEKCRERLTELIQDKKLSPREQTAFERIVAAAEAGRWEDAQNDSLAFAQAQIR